MSLTTFLLADAVNKGGPGSGPQGGQNSDKDDKDKAFAKSILALLATKKAAQANIDAAKAHEDASTAASKIGDDKLSYAHTSMANFHANNEHELNAWRANAFGASLTKRK